MSATGRPTTSRTETAVRGISVSPDSVVIRERWRSRARVSPAPTSFLPGWGKQLPVPLGDDFDGVVDHLYCGLIVDRVCGHWYPGGPFFDVGQGSIRHVLALEVRKQREINQSQRSIAAGERLTVVVGLSSELGGRD